MHLYIHTYTHTYHLPRLPDSGNLKFVSKSPRSLARDFAREERKLHLIKLLINEGRGRGWDSREVGNVKKETYDSVYHPSNPGE